MYEIVGIIGLGLTVNCLQLLNYLVENINRFKLIAGRFVKFLCMIGVCKLVHLQKSVSQK